MQPPAGRKEDSKLTRTLVRRTSGSSSFERNESANERRGDGREDGGGGALSLKAFVRPSKRHTIRRLRSRTWPG